MGRMEPGVSITRLEPYGEDRFQRLRAELGVETFGLNLIRLGPGQRGRIHAHRGQEEVYLVLEGTLTLELGPDERRRLGRYELVRVAPEVRRRLANDDDERLLLVALGASRAHEGRDGLAWASWDEPGEGRPPQEVPLPGDASRGP
jgi:uncharacterized cupin superfamily protein